MNLARNACLEALRGPILVTGHTGFKGTWLTILLEKIGIEVIGYSLEPEANSLYQRAGLANQIPEFFGDIRDQASFSRFLKAHKPISIIHLAAQPLVLKSYKAPLETFEVNVIGTAKILEESFRSDSIQSIVVVTTDKVYENSNLGRTFVETDSLSGKDPYSASKVGTESVVAAWQQIQKISGGPAVCSVRAGNVIGGGDYGENRLFPDIIRAQILQNKVEIRNMKSTRPWQHALDPLIGYLMVLEKIQTIGIQESFNFGPTEPSLSVEEAISVALANWPIEMEFIVSGSQKQNLESKLLDLSSKKAIQSLGWTPTWSQTQAIAKTMNWWERVLLTKIDSKSAIEDDVDEFLSLFQSKRVSSE
jgi:CDP-glucose 4,6-dehydratase